MVESVSKGPRQQARPRAFIVVQLFFAGMIAAGLAQWLSQSERRGETPPLRQQPLSAEPRYDWPEVVADEQLYAVLRKVLPTFRHPEPNVGYVDHALRLWGPEAQFRDPACLSGEELRQIILDHSAFAKAWGRNERPLLQMQDGGVTFRTNQGLASSPHVDHTLAGLTEICTPLDFPVNTVDGVTSMRALLEGSLREFSLNQAEYEWSVLAYTLAVEPNDGWVTSEGQTINFDILAERVMRQFPSQGVCQGHHRSHALVMMLNIDDQTRLLSSECRQRIMAHLARTVDQLVQVQHPEGYWDQHWADCADGTCCATSAEPTPLRKRLIGTGHVMEWLSLAPPETLPPRDVIVRAGQWMARTVAEMDDDAVAENYSFITHIARSLALWRGHLPVELIDELEANAIGHADASETAAPSETVTSGKQVSQPEKGSSSVDVG